MFNSCLTRVVALASRPAYVAVVAFFSAFALLASPASAQQADLVVNQADSPDPGPAGGVFTYTIRVDNNGPNAAIGINFSDTLPPGSTFVGATPTQGSCGAPVAGVVTCPLGDLTFLANATVTVQVILPTAGVWTNTATATSSTTDPNTGNNLNVTEDTTAQNASDMTLTVIDAPDPVNAGGGYNYTVTAINNGPTAAASQTIAFTIPAGACVTALPSGGGWACVPNTGYPRCSGTITCTRSTSLASGASAPALTVPAVANVGGSITAAFQVSSPLQDGNPADNTVTASTTVNGGFSDVAITKAASPAIVGVGSNVTYTLTPRFNGGEPPGAGGGLITVTDTLPAGLTLTATPTGTGWSCASVPAAPAPGPVTITCDRPGPFTPNFTNMPTITIVATVTAVGAISNTATIAAPENDPNIANNSSTVGITGSNSADLSITKTVSQSPVVPGFDFTYTLTPRNNGPVAVAIGQTVTVTDTLPAGLNLRAAVTGTGWSCSTVPVPPFPLAGPVTITCTRTLVATQAAGSNFPVITVPVESNSAGLFTNTVCIAASGTGPSDSNPANDCGSVNVISTDATLAADLRVVSKTASPDPVLAGQDLTYIINVQNDGPGNATNVVVSDALGSLVGAGGFQSATPSQGTCTPSGVTAGPTVNLSCNLGTLVNGASASVTVVVRPSIATTGTRTNTATITSLDVGDPNRENNSGAVTSAVTAVADVIVTKTDTPDPVQAGTPLTYVITARNNGPSTASTVVVTDTLPANAVFLSLSATTGAPICATPPVNSLGGTLTCTWASIAGGAQQTATVIVRPLTGAATVHNDAVITTTTLESNTGNNSGFSDTAVTGATVDILVNKVDSVDPVALGQMTTYTVTVTNAGPSFATNVVLTDTYPVGSPTATFSYQGNLTINPPGIGTCIEPALDATAGTLSCTFPGIANAQSAVVTYDMRAEAIAAGVSGTTFNGASVTADETETLPNNNATTHATTSRRVADLALVKSAPASVIAGGTLAWTLTITNNGPNPSTGAVVTDALPAGVVFQSASAGCGFATGTVTCTLGTLASGANTAVTINVVVTDPYTGANPLVNSATVAAVSEVDTVPGNNTGNASTTITQQADLSLTKTVDNASPAVGTNVVFTITVTNSGPNAAASVQVSDLLPAGYAFVSATPSVGSYMPGTGIWAIGNLAFPGSATLTITATVNVSGPYVNTATVSSPTTDPNPGNETGTSTPVPLTGPSLAKTIAPATIVSGNATTLTMTLGHANPIALSLTSAFLDTMPSGVTTTSANTGTCTGVTVTSTQITMASGSTIPVGGCTIVVTITSSTPGTVTNTTGSLQSNGGTAPPASAPLTVTATSSTTVKTILPSTIVAGGTATMTITLANANATPLTLSAPFTDDMPAFVTTTSGNTGTCTGVTVTPTQIAKATGSTIPPGGCTIVVTITSTTPGTVTNTTSTLVTEGGTAPPASAPLTVTPVVATLAKSITPSTIAPGGVATLTITLGNPNPTALNLSAAFTDTMPGGVTTVSGNSGTCAGVSVGITFLTMASGSVIPPGGCTIVVSITSSTPGTVTNTTGSLQTEAGTTPPASAPLTVTLDGVTLAKSITPATIVAGGTATLTITFGNPGTSALTLTAVFADTMPAGVTTTSGNTGTCTGVTVAPAQITMATGSTIPPGGCTIVVTITSSTVGTVLNTTSALQTGGGTAPAASAPLTVTGDIIADLAITKSNNVTTVAPGSLVTYTIVVTNLGPGAVTGATVTDIVPAALTGVTWTCVASAGSSCPASGSGNINASVNLLSGGTATFTLRGTLSASASGTLTNTATVAPPTGATDPAPGNNSGTDSDPIAATVVDLAIVKTHGGTLTKGQVGAQYAITVTNVGSVPSVGTVTVAEIPPAGLTVTAMVGTGWSCVQPAGPCTRSDPLAAGASYPAITVTANVAGNAPSPLVNAVTVAGGEDANAANNSSQDVVTFGPVISSAEPIPVDSRAALMLLGAVLALLGARRLRRSR